MPAASDDTAPEAPAMSTNARNGDFVDAGGLRTYYEVAGDGSPLLLLHGGMCPVETFDGLTPLLAAQHRVYTPERRGHGRTPDVEGPITFAIMAADTIAFMEALPLERADLVGWSDGAAVALRVALRRPDLVRRLVLIGQPVNSASVDASAKSELEEKGIDVLPPFLRDLYAAVSPDGPEHFETVFEKLSPQWLSDDEIELADLKAVQAPTLVMAGEQDVLTAEHGAEMRDALPDGRLQIVADASHGLPMEQPDVTSRFVLDFLAG